MKKSALTILLLLSACEKDDAGNNVGIIDQIKIFLGLQKPELPVDDDRGEGQSRAIPPIQSTVSNGDWQGGDASSQDVPSNVEGPGQLMPEQGANTDIMPRVETESQSSEFSAVPNPSDEETKTQSDIPEAAPLPEQPVEIPSIEAPIDMGPTAETPPALVYGPDMPMDENIPAVQGDAEKNPEDVPPQDRSWSASGLDYGFPGEGVAENPDFSGLPNN